MLLCVSLLRSSCPCLYGRSFLLPVVPIANSFFSCTEHRNTWFYIYFFSFLMFILIPAASTIFFPVANYLVFCFVHCEPFCKQGTHASKHLYPHLWGFFKRLGTFRQLTFRILTTTHRYQLEAKRIMQYLSGSRNFSIYTIYTKNLCWVLFFFFFAYLWLGLFQDNYQNTLRLDRLICWKLSSLHCFFSFQFYIFFSFTF